MRVSKDIIIFLYDLLLVDVRCKHKYRFLFIVDKHRWFFLSVTHCFYFSCDALTIMGSTMVNFFSKFHEAMCSIYPLMYYILKCYCAMQALSLDTWRIYRSLSCSILKQIYRLLQAFQRKVRSSMCMYCRVTQAAIQKTSLYWFIQIILLEPSPSTREVKGFINGPERRWVTHHCIFFIHWL